MRTQFVKRVGIVLAWLTLGLGVARGGITNVNAGTAANSHDGDPLRTAFIKINTNFAYLDGLVSSNTVNGAAITNLTPATAFNPQTAHLFYGGPTSGSAAGPTFRVLEVGDLPAGITSSNAQAHVTISADGIANGRSSLTNAGRMFGPDIPGTTTSGLQEALNSMAKGAAQGPTAAGISLELGPGYFYFTNALVWSNTYSAGIKITGETLLNTKLVYAGSNAGISCITIVGGGDPSSELNLPNHVVIRDVGFSQINNYTNILLRVTNYSHAEVSACNFTGWQIMTNANWGSSMSINEASDRGNAVGLVIGNTAEHGTFLHDLYFAGLADGFHALCDHLYATGLKFANIGYDASIAHTTAWSTGSPYSLGAAILRRPGLNSYYGHPHFYAANLGLVVLNPSGADDQILDDMLSEGTEFDLAAQTPTGVNFLLNTPNWDGTKGIVSTSPYSVSGSAAVVAAQAIYTTNGNTTFPVLHIANNATKFWDKVSLSSEVKNKLPTGSLDYNSSGNFTPGRKSAVILDPNDGDISVGAALDDGNGNLSLPFGSFIITSNVYPVAAWSRLAPSSFVLWNSNGFGLYAIWTNSLNNTAKTNLLAQ